MIVARKSGKGRNSGKVFGRCGGKLGRRSSAKWGGGGKGGNSPDLVIFTKRQCLGKSEEHASPKGGGTGDLRGANLTGKVGWPLNQKPNFRIKKKNKKQGTEDA